MPIPQSRSELLEQLETSFAKLRDEIEKGGSGLGSAHCIDDWTAKELLAVRAWWTESVVKWVSEGRRGIIPVTPAPGYRWKETPRLNADIAKRAGRESYASVCRRLEQGYADVVALIDDLSDHELLEIGVFEWAGKYPVRRWISLNTVRQYTTARSYLRRALRARGL